MEYMKFPSSNSSRILIFFLLCWRGVRGGRPGVSYHHKCTNSFQNDSNSLGFSIPRSLGHNMQNEESIELIRRFNRVAPTMRRFHRSTVLYCPLPS